MYYRDTIEEHHKKNPADNPNSQSHNRIVAFGL